MRHRTAVTLLELLIVLAIFGFLAAVSIPSIQTLILRNQIHQASTALVDITNQAKLLAATKGINVTIAFSNERSALLLTSEQLSKPLHLPEESDNFEKSIHDSLQFEFKEIDTDKVVPGIRVTPLGEIASAQVSLNRQGKVIELFETHRLTGEMRRVKK